jgi:hypothetical protein
MMVASPLRAIEGRGGQGDSDPAFAPVALQFAINKVLGAE